MNTQLITSVKPVKNSCFIQESTGDYVALHYNSEILRVSNGEVKTLYVPSVTSSKMAKRCLEYIGITEDWKSLKKRFGQ